MFQSPEIQKKNSSKQAMFTQINKQMKCEVSKQEMYAESQTLKQENGSYNLQLE